MPTPADEVPSSPYQSHQPALAARITLGGALTHVHYVAGLEQTFVLDQHGNVLYVWPDPQAIPPAGATSVGLSAPPEFSVSGSPVTTAGTLGLSWVAEPPGAVLAGPASGPAGQPGFRALVEADIPALPASQITSGQFLPALLPADATEAATNDTLGPTSTIFNTLDRIRYQLAQLGTGAWNTLRAMVQLSPAGQQTGTINVSGQIQGADFAPGGLPGATAPTRYVGGTTGGAPTSGSFLAGDFVVGDSGEIWVCTVAGTPGSWVQIGAAELEHDSAVSALPDPTDWPSLVATSPSPATSLAAGTYHVGYCWLTPQGGRTKLSKTAVITITAGQGIQCTAPALPAGASGVEFYIDDCAPVGIGNSWDGGAAFGTLASQSWAGGAAFGALASQSWAGGAAYGVFDSQSWSGGASVAGVPYWVTAQQGGAHPTSVFEFFFKVPQAPSGDTTLVDFNAGASGYVRVKLTSALHVFAELNLPNTNGVVVQSWDISTNAISPNVWYYVEVTSNPINNFTWRYVGRVQGPGGVSVGSGDVYWPLNTLGNNEINSGSDINLTMTVGVGASLSSSYLPFPNTAGWEVSKLWLHQAGPGGSLAGMPLADRSGGDLYYSGRQTVGAAAQLTDTSGNARHATAAAQGLTINADGPYA